LTKIQVIIEIAKGKIVSITKECITAAKIISESLNADLEGVIIGHNIAELASEATKYGLKKIIKIDDSRFEGVNILFHTRTLEALIKQDSPDIIIAGASLYGQEVMPRLAARFNSAMFPSVKGLKADDGELEATHPLFEEKLFAKMESDLDHTNFITVLGASNPEVELDDSLTGEVVDFTPVIEDSDNRESFVEEKIAKISVDITKAKLLVSGGRGVGGKEKFAVIVDAAKALGGEVGASRAAVDADWVAYDHEIGQTGKTVTPDFYIACGISGAIQHIVGMRNSKCIIAINTDEEAPIIEVAHYAIIADLHEVLPEMLKQL